MKGKEQRNPSFILGDVSRAAIFTISEERKVIRQIVGRNGKKEDGQKGASGMFFLSKLWWRGDE